MITISTSYLLEWCAIIVAIGGAITYLVKGINTAKRPIEELQRQLDEHLDMLARDKRRLDDLERQIQGHDGINRLMLECLLAVLGHLEEGNHTQQMAETRKKVELFLLEKK